MTRSTIRSYHVLQVQLLSFIIGVGSWLALPGLIRADLTVIDNSQAVDRAQVIPGTGLCGSVTHFMAAQPLVNLRDAVDVLDKPTTDPAILGRVSKIFDNFNFRNGQPNTNGDFTLPDYRDEVFPFSLDPMGVPMGTDSNIAIRFRGYFNVPDSLAGKIISFGLNCDDYCAIRLGGTDLTPPGNELVSARVVKQVSFRDSGLYPIEIIYYQNGSTAYLEWSRSSIAVPECPNDICQIPFTDAQTYHGQFKLIQPSELYSAIVGSNSDCRECGAPGMNCQSGRVCNNGLCQTCNTSSHCGPDCSACPANAPVCTQGKCVPCVSDTECPVWIPHCEQGTCIESSKLFDACQPMPPCPPGSACSPTKLSRPGFAVYPHQRICGCSVCPSHRTPSEKYVAIWMLISIVVGGVSINRRLRQKSLKI